MVQETGLPTTGSGDTISQLLNFEANNPAQGTQHHRSLKYLGTLQPRLPAGLPTLRSVSRCFDTRSRLYQVSLGAEKDFISRILT
ncbi:hypothetical protein CHU98_g10293 [Xylaria longipes]|nr:hypothetical protein CHU98_g10293 [Xylaria longipes]